MLAAVAAGEYSDCGQATANMVKTAFTVEPGANVEIYSKYFRKYEEINHLVMPTYQGDL